MTSGTSSFKLTAAILVIVMTGLVNQLTVSCSSRVKHKDAVRETNPVSLKILTLGDSNGALADGWVNQLKKIRSGDTILNISVSGNTIGFNNNGQRSLNTLANIRSYLDQAYKNLKRIDAVIIILGTNDCKAVFKDSVSVVPQNMRKILQEIKQNPESLRDKPAIFLVTPPPFGPDEMLQDKYKGGLERITWLNEKLADIALEENVIFINTFSVLLPVFKSLSSDGVHLNADGQMMTALIIQENLKYLKIK